MVVLCITGTVLKRFDPTKLFVLVCQDIVERFHLIIILSFVLVEEATGLGNPLPSTRLIRQCWYVLMAEIVIDVTKHAVLGKFNDIRPGVYQEFTKDLCENLAASQSHTMHKLVGIEPFAAAALFFRVAVSFIWLQYDITVRPITDSNPWMRFLVVAASIVSTITVWLIMTAATLLLGYLLRALAVTFVNRYERWRQKSRASRVWFPSHAGKQSILKKKKDT